MRFIPQMLFSVIKNRYSHATLILLFFVFTMVPTVVAIPLTEYRERVHQSVLKLDSLKTIGEDTSEDVTEELIARTLQEVRALLPITETIDSGVHSLKIDNSWLNVALAEYEDLYGASGERQALLTQTTERLVALEDALAELDTNNASPPRTATKEESKARLSNILLRDEYSKKSAEGNALNRLLKRFTDWLRGLFPKSRPMDPSRSGLVSKIVQLIVVGLTVALIAFVAWKLWPRIWRSHGKSKSKGKKEARVVLGERLEADQTSADLLAEAEALARAGNLRGAIRKGYIALLCELGDRKVIGLAQHKTNRDYLNAVRSQEHLYQQMQFLTNSFEIHWYGFVPVDADDWNAFRAQYHQTLGQR